MKDQFIYEYPDTLTSIIEGTKTLGFDMPSEPKAGAFLKILAASKPNSQFLEIGTGTGLSAAWILKGMDSQSKLLSIDSDKKAQNIALENLGYDPRFEAVHADGGEWLEKNQDERYDFIFADAWPGKFSHIELALNLLNKGGMYIIDDLLPQPNWPERHAAKVTVLIDQIEQMSDYTAVRIGWASGLMVAVRK